MSTSRPLQCLFASLPKPRPRLQHPHHLPPRKSSLNKRCFHPSSALFASEKSQSYPKLPQGTHEPSAETKALRKSPRKPSKAKQLSSPYSPQEIAALEDHYSPEQIESIKAGEAAIPREDLIQQGVINRGPMTINYLDDFSMMRPYIDKPVRAPEENYDPNLRFKDDDELAEDLHNWIHSMPENPDRVEWTKYADNARVMVGDEQAERNPYSYLMPELPKLKHDGLLGTKGPEEMEADNEEPDEALQRLILQTGYTRQQIRRFLTKNLVLHRVVNQTRMGKVQSMYCLYVAGNGRGLVGIGEGKSAEPEDARKQAMYAAIRLMQPVPRYEERTIYGDVKGKVGATEVELMTRHPGRSIPILQ